MLPVFTVTLIVDLFQWQPSQDPFPSSNLKYSTCCKQQNICENVSSFRILVARGFNPDVPGTELELEHDQ